MDWTIEINDGYLLERQQFVFENTEIKRIEPIEEIKEVYSLSPFCQFFLRSVATGYLNLYASFPIPDKESHDFLLKELSPHFQKILADENPDGLITNLTFINAKPPSARFFYSLYQKGELEPIVKDLYSSNISYPEPPLNGVIHYKVKQQFITPIDLPSFDSTWIFLKKLYAKERRFFITTYGWTFSDKLAQSIAIRYFIKRCQEVILIKHKNNNRIRGIDICF